jgi:preprotein translocase subunit SecA
MKFRLEDCVQRGHNYAIVDEVDSILIDEARTPLIISGPSEESTDKYYKVNRIIPKLMRGEVIEGKEPGEKYTTGDYTIDEKHRSAALTEEGVLKVEKLLGIGNCTSRRTSSGTTTCSRRCGARALPARPDYVVKDGEVIIVDEFTGRLMPGRRWSDGLHQAVEAKEGVKIERENQTLATITFQNYFRMYKKLAGMTGTAETEAAEFQKIYKLDVTVIPTNRPMIRKEIRTSSTAPRREVPQRRQGDQGVSGKGPAGAGGHHFGGEIGAAVRHAEERWASARGAERQESRARSHIVAQAGPQGRGHGFHQHGRPRHRHSAGRQSRIHGRDACLRKQGKRSRHRRREQGRVLPRAAREVGRALAEVQGADRREHDEVVALGGLHIVGTERHDSRRIDNQLRGRAGRQGDPGSSRFFLSLQDDLLRIFGGERMQNLMLRLGMEEDVPIESKLITKRIAKAQEAVEAQNFEARKHLLEYDDVMNKQRQAVYGMRRSCWKASTRKSASWR